MAEPGRYRWQKVYWVPIVTAGVVLHGGTSLIRGVHLSPHPRVSVWLVLAVIMSFAGGWWVASKPERLEAQSPAFEWAFAVALVVFLLFDLLDHQGGVLIRNGVTALAWIAGVSIELGRQAAVRRSLAAGPVSPGSSR